MEDLELAWLVPTALQVIGLAIGLSVLGLVYERATRKRVSFLRVLEERYEIRWLAMASVIFATGVSFSGMGWITKGIAIALGVLLIGLAITTPVKSHRGE